MRLQLVLAGIAAAGLASAAEITVIEEIVAKVNGEIITRGDIERTRKQMEATMREQGATGQRLTEAMAETDKNILRERIDQLLLQSKAKELNLNVDSEVAKQLADIQRKSGLTDPDKFQQFVRDQTGMSYEDYKNDRKNDLLTNRVIRQEVASKITIKHEEAQQYYDGHQDEFKRQERVYLRELLVGTPSGADTAQALKKAKDLADRGKKGEKFEDLARNNSDSASAQQDGDIGAYEKGKLRPEIEKTVWDQPRGYVTDPINVGNGFLILKVEEHQKAGLASLDEVLPEITNKLFNPRFNPELRRYLTQLRVNAFLEIKAGYEDSGAAPGKNTAWVDPAEIKPETITKEQVAARQRHRRLLGLVPIPGTSTQSTGTSSSR
jgi:peptidyl-prolyl cis-trans isomerase SurA